MHEVTFKSAETSKNVYYSKMYQQKGGLLWLWRMAKEAQVKSFEINRPWPGVHDEEVSRMTFINYNAYWTVVA